MGFRAEGRILPRLPAQSNHRIATDAWRFRSRTRCSLGRLRLSRMGRTPGLQIARARADPVKPVVPAGTFNSNSPHPRRCRTRIITAHLGHIGLGHEQALAPVTLGGMGRLIGTPYSKYLSSNSGLMGAEIVDAHGRQVVAGRHRYGDSARPAVPICVLWMWKTRPQEIRRPHRHWSVACAADIGDSGVLGATFRAFGAKSAISTVCTCWFGGLEPRWDWRCQM